MVNPLVNILLGAGEQYMADEDASDKLKGEIIDATSVIDLVLKLLMLLITMDTMKMVILIMR
jgi:hypothetical protein